jgi:hypothetical protein
MTGRYSRLMCVTLTLLALAGPSEAARRSSLSGNLLIPDQDDVFFFPQLIVKQARMVTFDFGTESDQGSGGFVFGNESITLGAYTHRSDFLGALPNAFLTRGDIDNISDEASLPIGVGPDALNWIDVIAGFGIGETPMGVRFSLGRNNDDPADPTVESDVTAINVIVGMTLERWDSDLSVEGAWASGRELAAMVETETSPYSFGVGFRRHAGDGGDDLEMGWIGMFNWVAGTVDVGSTEVADNQALNLVLGAGPMYHPNDRTTVAMYGTFEWDRQRQEAGTATDTFSRITIPGWNIAGEFDLASWLQFRAGMRSSYVFVTQENEDVGVSDTAKSNQLDFGWTTGLGFTVGGLQIDAFLNPDVITTGTDLLGEGGDGTVFGMVSTTLRF